MFNFKFLLLWLNSVCCVGQMNIPLLCIYYFQYTLFCISALLPLKHVSIFSIHLTMCPRSLPSRPTSISKAYFLPQSIKYSTFSIFSFRIIFSHCYCTFLSGNLVQIFKNKEFFVESLNICFLCKTLNASFSPKNFCSIFSRLHVFSSIQENHPKI